jgi:hypothetical protein
LFDFLNYHEPAWPEDLKPVGGSSADREKFEPWWERHKETLGHLHSQIVEQWVHRHWTLSEFNFLPLESLSWELVSKSGDEILASVRPELWSKFDPDFDYDALHGDLSFPKSQTALAFDELGTWDYPIIALSTPSGWFSRKGEFPDERLMLIEGHQRYRYLNALHAKQMQPGGEHQLFVISSPKVT